MPASPRNARINLSSPVRSWRIPLAADSGIAGPATEVAEASPGTPTLDTGAPATRETTAGAARAVLEAELEAVLDAGAMALPQYGQTVALA
jgi:hypothetical protein